MEQLEIVPRHYVDGIHIFINRVEYRSPHFHPEWEFLWVLDTPLSITSGQEHLLIQPGEVVLFPPNYPHEFHKMEGPSTFLCLQIANWLFPSASKRQTEDLRLGKHLGREQLRELQGAMLDIGKHLWGQSPFSELYCMGLCAMILYGVLNRMPSHTMTAEETANLEQRNARLTRLLQFVDENYMHKIRLADFARQEGRSLSHMSHFVRETMNQTFQEYVQSVRFNAARKRIASGKESLVSICAESGFSDYRYFSRMFQKNYGMTPAEYRLHAQENPSENMVLSQSLHSLESIYSPAESLVLAAEFEKQIKT